MSNTSEGHDGRVPNRVDLINRSRGTQLTVEKFDAGRCANVVAGARRLANTVLGKGQNGKGNQANVA